jgi:hypothetical protein
MATSIQVKESTLQTMKDIKNELDLKSYDELINVLVELRRKIPRSKFGAHPEMSEFTAKDEGNFHEL